MSPMPPNWWTAGGCVAGCWPAIAGRGKAVSAAGGARTLHEDGGVPLVQHAASRGAGGVEACRRSRVVGVVSGPSDPRYRAGGLWAVWSCESRSGHDGGIVRGVAQGLPVR